MELRRVPVPPHRYTPLKDNWMKIFTPIVEQLKLQIRLNLKSRSVELRVGTPSRAGGEREGGWMVYEGVGLMTSGVPPSPPVV